MTAQNTAFIFLLAALYHESGRASVQNGSTLAHTEGQARPFSEFHDLTADARDGRVMTASNLDRRIEVTGMPPLTSMNPPADLAQFDADCAALARIIHECEREAIEKGMVVVKLDPPRPWLEFDQLPAEARRGRRLQAAFFLCRFTIAFKSEAA